MAILATHDLAERIACAVIGADLPLGTQIFQPKIADVLSARVHIVLFGDQVSVGNPNVMAGVAKRAGVLLVQHG